MIVADSYIPVGDDYFRKAKIGSTYGVRYIAGKNDSFAKPPGLPGTHVTLLFAIRVNITQVLTEDAPLSGQILDNGIM